MTVLDVGAHHGLYTLLASKCVGRKGRVIAFEASPRECRRLQRHVSLNRCTSVLIESRSIVEFLASMDYRWFALAPDSSLQPVSNDLDSFDENMVALPCERAREFRSLVDRKRMFFPLYQPRPSSGRDRGIEILKSMVRVRPG